MSATGWVGHQAEAPACGLISYRDDGGAMQLGAIPSRNTMDLWDYRPSEAAPERFLPRDALWGSIEKESATEGARRSAYKKR